MKKFLLLFVIQFLLLVPNLSDAQSRVGTCLRVIDGDTYIFATANDTLRVRDAYMNTPEPKNSVCSLAQPYSQESSAKANELLLGTKFKIVIIGTDIYGRTLAFAILNSVGYYHKYMINNGYAWSYKQSGINYKLQLIAKENKIGLWAGEDPINPSIWLKNYSTRKH